MKNEFENIHHNRMNELYFLLVDIKYRRPHLHFDMELIFVLEGEGHITTSEQSYPIKAGQASFFNSCQVHEISSEHQMKLLIMQFSATAFDLTLPQLEQFYFDNQPFNYQHNSKLTENMLKASLFYFEDTNNQYENLKTHAFASLTLYELLQVCPHNIRSLTQQNKLMDLQERLQRITSYIHEHYTSKISLEELANREAFSRTYFSHFFKTHFGISFKEYLDNIRCDKARSLLLTTNENLLTISYLCGFSDIRTLNNAFQRRYGELPRHFRNNKELLAKLPSQKDYAETDDIQKIYTELEAHQMITAFSNISTKKVSD